MLEVILKTLENVPKDVPYNVPKERVELILENMRKNPSITLKDLATLVMVSEKTIKRDIEKMKQDEKVKHIGSARKGSWKVL
jgi:DeoR/GlpR family transcriptional regulator of sugar metabolism